MQLLTLLALLAFVRVVVSGLAAGTPQERTGAAVRSVGIAYTAGCSLIGKLRRVVSGLVDIVAVVVCMVAWGRMVADIEAVAGAFAPFVGGLPPYCDSIFERGPTCRTRNIVVGVGDCLVPVGVVVPQLAVGAADIALVAFVGFGVVTVFEVLVFDLAQILVCFQLLFFHSISRFFLTLISLIFRSRPLAFPLSCSLFGFLTDRVLFLCM